MIPEENHEAKSGSSSPYRSPAPARRPSRLHVRDVEVVVALLLIAPVFIGVVVRAIARGEFGAGPTLCLLAVFATALVLRRAFSRRA